MIGAVLRVGAADRASVSALLGAELSRNKTQEDRRRQRRAPQRPVASLSDATRPDGDATPVPDSCAPPVGHFDSAAPRTPAGAYARAQRGAVEFQIDYSA